MKNLFLTDLRLTVSVKKEYKNLLRSIWDELHPRRMLATTTMSEKRFGISFDVEANTYNRIRPIFNAIREFYPEADLTIEVRSF